MSDPSNPSIRTLNELDHVRLGKLVGDQYDDLQGVLDSADVLSPSQIPADVVTMRSRVRVVEQANGAARELSLAYPTEADVTQGQVSVLSPIGSALLGRRVGEAAQWTLPDGRSVAVTIDALLFQPEASGEYLR